MNARPILSLEEIVLSFGGKPLFDGLSLHICEQDRICLVGKNGAGKTTLMRLMTEDLELDSGTRFLYPGTSVGYLAQSVRFAEGDTVHQFVLSGLAPEMRDEHHHYLADMVIAPLDLHAGALMSHLSGGQQRRAALARALVTDPDILLLDEPTNHLDVTTIEWLESYLKGFRGAVVCVSHDRTFLANISRKVLWIDRGRIRVCPYSYAQFEDWLEEQVEQEARELQNLQKQVAAEHDWTQGGVTGRRKRNARRLRELGRLREKLVRDKSAYKQRSQKIDMDAIAVVNTSKIVAEFKSVSKHFTQDRRAIPILHEFSHTILKGDRLGILGRNGSGKSSFIKLLMGEIEPDTGRIFRSKSNHFSYFDQARSDLNPTKTLWETLCPDGGSTVALGGGEDAKTIHVCGYLKRFLFDPSQAHDKVSTLSGGQQNRLLLAKILACPGNVLILDEPTNDLDMDTLDMLQEMIADYSGTLLIVSHDRDFLDRTVTEVMAFEGNAEVITLFGGYSDYVRHKHATQNREEKATRKAQAAPAQPAPAAPPTPPSPAPAPALPKLTYGERIELKKLPERIAEYEATLKVLQSHLDETGLYERDPTRCHQLITDFATTRDRLELLEQRWLELAARQEQEDR